MIAQGNPKAASVSIKCHAAVAVLFVMVVVICPLRFVCVSL